VNKLGFVLGFVPWIVFSLVAQRLDANGVAWSATIAVVMTVVALVAARRKHGPTFLSLASLVLFGAIAVVGFVGGPGVDRLLVLATASARPFTAEYARQSVPREYWDSPTFRRINTVLSAVWGAGILVIGLAAVAVTALDAHATDATRNNTVDLLLNWVVPIAVIWGAMKFTATYPDRVDRAADPATS
jgi:hypothetical protein